MPQFETASRTFEISRAAVITDSNLFVEAFIPGSHNHDWANYFLEESRDQWVVPISVVVETWGQIVGSRGNWTAGLNFLAWLNTPGKDLLVIGHEGDLDDEREIIEALRVDCVDAMILTLARRIFDSCNLETPLRIATSDLRDFLRFGGRGIPFQLYDWTEIDTQEML